ncbi:MAG: hypothetical protein HC905_19335 [Bacteroidales bacterium]|nr:hypothetical protein [Bacteroidales bacterium]
MNKEKLIEQQLEKIDPAIVPVFKEGTAAMDQRNYPLADSLYSIVYAKVPGFDPLLRRLGTIRFELGKPVEGLELCKKAVEIEKSAYNLLSLAYCYTLPGELQNFGKSLDLLREAEKLPNGSDLDIIAMKAQLALQLSYITEFEEASRRLSALYPDEMVTHYFSALAASIKEDWEKAESEILLAQKLGLPEETVKEFLGSGISSNLNKNKYTLYFFWLIAIWAIGLMLLFITGKLLSNYTVRSIERQIQSKNPVDNNNFLRPLYRFLINIGGVYYYLSLPIILILVLALVGGLLYFFLMIGRIPVQLMLALIVGAGFTIYGMAEVDTL